MTRLALWMDSNGVLHFALENETPEIVNNWRNLHMPDQVLMPDSWFDI